MPKPKKTEGRVDSTTALAAKLGLSRWAVSRALNGRPGVSKSTAARVRTALAEHNFEPNPFARALRGGSSNTVAICIAHDLQTTNIRGSSDAWSAALQVGLPVLCKTLKENGLHPITLLGPEMAQDCELLRRAQALRSTAAIVVEPHFTVTAIQSAQLADPGFPCVCIDPAHDLPFTAVKTDHTQAARMVLEHLRQLGHKKLALLHMRRESLLVRGFESASATLGYPERGGLRLLGPDVLPTVPTSSVALGWSLADVVLGRRIGVTALIGSSDDMAFGALARLRQEGKQVPEDYSVVGCGNTAYSAYCSPSLTTVDLQIARLFEQAARTLCEQLRMGDHIETREVSINPLFFKRSSTGPSKSADPPAFT